jgi:septal ring factor EnvC (AmiA/AmiB activator)
LITDEQPSSAGTSQSFQLTPLQAYFADVYGNLQTELADTKKKQKLRLVQLLEQQKYCEGLRRELESERAARREAEQALHALRSAQADGVTRSSSQADELEAARQEVDDLKRAIAHIRSICALPLDHPTSTGDSI